YLRAGLCNGTRTFLSALRILHSALRTRSKQGCLRSSRSALRPEMRVPPLLTCGLVQWNADIPVRTPHSALRTPHSKQARMPAFQSFRPYLRAGYGHADYRQRYQVQIQRSGSASWENTVIATSNPTEITVTPTTPNQPERILVRALLYKGTEPVGIPSDPTYVTVNP
ncbi:MAG: hypothetical protein ACRD6X_15510, partial [Pyrinomonadaceae bacterium]